LPKLRKRVNQMILKTYKDFLERVDELGFMSLSRIMPGLPSVSEETLGTSWHTGDHDTDPWQWKDRAAEEKKLAYGCIIGGYKGFVSARMYPYFYAAYQPMESMDERWESGEVNQTTRELWKVFEAGKPLNTGDIRRAMGVTAKTGGSRVDRSIQELQHDYYITVSGNERKVNKHGEPYGWPACVYTRVIDWAPADWMSGVSSIDPEVAREMILSAGVASAKDVTREVLADLLWRWCSAEEYIEDINDKKPDDVCHPPVCVLFTFVMFYHKDLNSLTASSL
ncbi:MAG: AlkZ-related protein, partial [Armatimonadota bacterium]